MRIFNNLYGIFLIIPIYLFHVWLPKAHVETPAYGSIALADVLLKIRKYGLIRLDNRDIL